MRIKGLSPDLAWPLPLPPVASGAGPQVLCWTPGRWLLCVAWGSCFLWSWIIYGAIFSFSYCFKLKILQFL